MSTAEAALVSAFDGHHVDAVRAALEDGADACSSIRGKRPIQWLLEEYTRSDRLGDCLRMLFERGAELPDPAIEPFLLNDADEIRRVLKSITRQCPQSVLAAKVEGLRKKSVPCL